MKTKLQIILQNLLKQLSNLNTLDNSKLKNLKIK